MNLFEKDKEFVLKVINGVLLIWLIIAVLLLFSNIVNLTIKEPNQSYNEYKIVNCSDTEITESDCKGMYIEDREMMKEQDYENYRGLIIYPLEFIIVGGALILLNKENKKKKKK